MSLILGHSSIVNHVTHKLSTTHTICTTFQTLNLTTMKSYFSFAILSPVLFSKCVCFNSAHSVFANLTRSVNNQVFQTLITHNKIQHNPQSHMINPYPLEAKKILNITHLPPLPFKSVIQFPQIFPIISLTS